MKTIVSILGLAAFAVILGGHSSGEGAEPSAITVKIENFSYNPNPVTVPVGATVTWVNRDIVPHDVVSDDKSFKSKLLEKNDHFAYVFSKPGTYHYVCSIHPKMTANVVVK
jgi:plastocyanin